MSKESPKNPKLTQWITHGQGNLRRGERASDTLEASGGREGKEGISFCHHPSAGGPEKSSINCTVHGVLGEGERSTYIKTFSFRDPQTLEKP